MSSAYHLTEMSLRPQFIENTSRSKGDMERTGTSRVNPMALNCDLDIESAYLIHGFCTLCQQDHHLTNFNEILLNDSGEIVQTKMD